MLIAVARAKRIVEQTDCGLIGETEAVGIAYALSVPLLRGWSLQVILLPPGFTDCSFVNYLDKSN